jgi:PAS domain S-box-containing protein
VRNSVTAIRGADGSFDSMLAVSVDITDRKAAEAALRESEARFRNVADHAPIMMWVTDPSGACTYLNRRWYEFTGQSEAEALGLGWTKATHPDDEKLAAEAFLSANAAQAPFRVEYRLRRTDGTFRWAIDAASPRFGPGGEFLGYVGSVIDIDERREAETRLRESEERFQAIADSVDQMIWSTRPDGFHDYYNRRWYEYTGVPEGSTDGEAWNGMFHPEDQPRAWEVWQRSLETGEPYRIEYRLRHRSGQYRWVLGRAQAVRDEAGRITRWFGTCTDIQDIVEAREVLARSREDLEREVAERTAERNVLATIVETTDAFVQVVDLDFRWLAINPAAAGEFERIFGVRPTAGQSMLDLLADKPEHRAAVEAVWSRALAGEEFTETAEFGDPGLDRRRYEMKFNALKGAKGERIGAFQIVTDATERLRREAELAEAQEQLRQAQKMEAVGQLTGGIAHDFNNLLAGIVGSLDLMQTRIAQGRTDTIERYAKAAMSSAQRAAALTHRLLAFSRRQPLDPKPLNANALVASMEDLLRRTIGPLHALELVTAGGLWTTLCDPNQLESAILNLAINARDAMPDGGKLTIETCNAHLDDAYAAASRDVTPGQYVCICVTDTGTGMGPEVIARAFEPFYTTKPLGQGTGLGLSMVYGFAKQSEGHLKIYSEVGRGTTVKLYLPRHRGEGAAEEEPAGPVSRAPRAEAGETVLVVEDEPVVRDLIVDVLQDLGYRALEAADGPSGLKLLQGRRRIDLLVTDVGLPGLNGRQLADQARERRPDLKVLFITGYAENATLANGFLDPGMEMITKPFAVEALASKIRSMIRNE